MENKPVEREHFTAGQKAKFIIPSVIGVLLLMTPFKIDGQSTVMVSVFNNWIGDGLSSIVSLELLVMITITASVFFTLLYKIAKPEWLANKPAIAEMLDVSPIWVVIRILGLLFGLAVAFGEQWSFVPPIIYHEDTGGLIFYDLILGLFTIFIVAGFILPFLTEFGLLEYVGVFFTKIMRPIFKLPGRSAVDCVASWIGDSTIGVTLTNKQYEEGYYNAKEAAIIATTFSAVSITFCLVVLSNVDMMDRFGFFYLTTAVAGVACALILPRIPPLSLKPETYYPGESRDMGEAIPSGFTRHQWGMHMAVKKAEASGGVGVYLKSAVETVVGLWFGVLPTAMSIGTIVLVIDATTPIFTWLGMPFLPLLNLLNVPLAAEAAPTMVIGFADMVVPSLMAAGMSNPMTQFIIAVMSVVQLLYMSETGAVILGSKLPISFLDLIIIFIERTIVSLPIVVAMAHIIF